MNHADRLPPPLDRFEIRSLQVGLAAAVLLLIGLFVSPAHAFRSYLFAWLYILGICLGCLVMAMVHALVGGRWGLVIRRFQEAAFSTLPYVLALGLPLIVGLRYLYPWARPEEVAHNDTLAYRSWCYNMPFFVIRAAVYFAVWTALAMLFRRWSEQYNRSPDDPHRLPLQRLSAAGILIYILTMTYASIDWILAREPDFYSTIIGFIVVVGQALAGFAFAILMLTVLARRRPFIDALTPTTLNDLGSILLTLVILFAYMSFAQYLIVWAGSIQHEVTWYVARWAGGWKFVTLALIALHFFVPFFALLSRENKRNPIILGSIAGLLLFMRLIDVLWWVAPSGGDPRDPPGVYWIDIVALLALGGIWLKLYLWTLKSRPLLMHQQPGAEIPAYVEQASTGME